MKPKTLFAGITLFVCLFGSCARLDAQTYPYWDPSAVPGEIARPGYYNQSGVQYQVHGPMVGANEALFAMGTFNANIDNPAPWNEVLRWTKQSGWLTIGAFGNPNTNPPTSDGFVTTMFISGQYLYVGGQFNFINFNGIVVPCVNIAKFDLINGTWSTVGNGLDPDAIPRSIVVDASNHIYVGFEVAIDTTPPHPETIDMGMLKTIDNSGYWQTVGGGLMKKNVDTYSWSTDEPKASVTALAADGTNIYVGGNFRGGINLNGTTNYSPHFIEWDGTKWIAMGPDFGTLGTFGIHNVFIEDWYPDFDADFVDIYSIALCGSYIYVGGHFTQPYGYNNDLGISFFDQGITRFQKVTKHEAPCGATVNRSDDPVYGVQYVYGDVYGLTVQNGSLYLTGHFNDIDGIPGGGSVTDINSIARFDGNTYSQLDTGLTIHYWWGSVAGSANYITANDNALFVGEIGPGEFSFDHAGNVDYSVAGACARWLTRPDPVCTPTPSGLVSWWPADFNSGSYYTDIYGRHSGQPSAGMTIQGGVVGSAFGFSGHDYVSVADAPDLNPGGAITVEGWLRRDAAVGAYDPVIKKAGSRGGTAGGYSLEFSGNNILFWVYNGAWRSSISAPIALGQWYHVAGVYDGSQLTLYVNGQPVGTPVSTSGSIVASSNPLRLGNDPSNPTRFFKGLLDEVSIYSQALSGAQILSIYNAGSAGKCPPPPPVCTPPSASLVSWWPADDLTCSDIRSGFNGQPTAGTTIQGGLVGNAFRFSGHDYVSVADAPTLNPTSAITVEGWINRQAAVGSCDPVIKKTGSNGSQTGGYSLEFSGNNLSFWIYNNGSYYGWTASASATLQLGQWYHVAGVYDGSSVRLYVNGSQVGNAVTTSGAIVPSTNQLRIGNDPSNPTTRFFNGLVDEASVYSAALTAAEIQAIYNAGSTGKCR